MIGRTNVVRATIIYAIVNSDIHDKVFKKQGYKEKYNFTVHTLLRRIDWTNGVIIKWDASLSYLFSKLYNVLKCD